MRYLKRIKKKKSMLQIFADTEFRPGRHSLKYWTFYLNGSVLQIIPTKTALKELVNLQADIVKYDKDMEEYFRLSYIDLNNNLPLYPKWDYIGRNPELLTK